MSLTDDQHAVEQLVAQGADEALAGGIHSGSLDGGAEDRGADCLEDGIEGTGEVRSAIAEARIESTSAVVFPKTSRPISTSSYPDAGRYSPPRFSGRMRPHSLVFRRRRTCGVNADGTTGPGSCWARIHDQDGDLRLLLTS